jgi:hypothetical protein
MWDGVENRLWWIHDAESYETERKIDDPGGECDLSQVLIPNNNRFTDAAHQI